MQPVTASSAPIAPTCAAWAACSATILRSCWLPPALPPSGESSSASANSSLDGAASVLRGFGTSASEFPVVRLLIVAANITEDVVVDPDERGIYVGSGVLHAGKPFSTHWS